MNLNIIRIAWIAVRELLHERVFYILLCFACLALGMSLVVGQMTYLEQYKLTVDFMLSAGEISLVLFSIFAGISLFQRELTMGSVSMTLAKPITRTTFLLGKFLGQCLVQLVMAAGMFLIVVCLTSMFRHPDILSIAETFWLISLESIVLTAICYFFAVNSGAIITAVISLCLFSVGHMSETISQNGVKGSSSFALWKIVKNIIPDLEVFNAKSLASYGVTLSHAELLWALLYCLVCMTFFLVMAAITFNAKDIPT